MVRSAHHGRGVFVAALVLVCSCAGNTSVNTCETIDGDCPDDCAAAGFAGTKSFTALLHIAPTNPAIQKKARQAQAYIKKQGHVHSADNPSFVLHTSLFYFCCHTEHEVTGIKKSLQAMKWQPFPVHYDSFSCNLDHDNSTVYLHALPSNQTDLFSLAHAIEANVQTAGFPMNHPRKSKFHMTLARVGYDYPIDDVVNYFLQNAADWDFGKLVVSSFWIGFSHYHALAQDLSEQGSEKATMAIQV